MTPRKPAPPVIKMRRARPDPPADEPVARVVEVIEVPYLKPIARRRRRDRIDCLIVWPRKVEAPIADLPSEPVAVVDDGTFASSAALPATTFATPAFQFPEAPPPLARPLLSTIIVGAAAACGYVLGSVAIGGPSVFAASHAVGLALLVAVVVASVALPAGNRGTASGRGLAVIAGALALTAVVSAGAGALRAP